MDGQDAQEAARRRGEAHLAAVLSQAEAGQDPFEHASQPLSRQAGQAGQQEVEAFGAAVQRYQPLLLAGGFVIATGASWVLMKGALLAMHTPSVLTFLHLLAAGVVQLAAVWWGLLAPPVVSAGAAKGALVQSTQLAAQVLLGMVILEHSSVFLLLSWVTVVPLLLGFTRAADVSAKGLVRSPPPQLHTPLAIAVAGLCLELLTDAAARPLVVLVPLLLWAAVAATEPLWRQLKADATLGHRILEPDFLFRARELSDLEDATSPSTLSFMALSMPALPVLVLGLLCLEGKDLVEHEPSVPTLTVLLLSCLSFAAAHTLRTIMAAHLTMGPDLHALLLAAAACVAILLELVERGRLLHNKLAVAGVGMAVLGSLAGHVVRSRAQLGRLGSVLP